MKAEIIKQSDEIKSITYKNDGDDVTTDDLINAGIIPKNCPPAQIKIFLARANELNLSPVKRQIYLIVRQTKNKITGKFEPTYTTQTSIDGFRSIADRSGVYAGNDDYLFDGNKTEYEVLNTGAGQPVTATATVYKIVGGLRCPFTATARFSEYAPTPLNTMWSKMPFLMLGKCAESLALRKAFPEYLGGLYTTDEMQQANNDAQIMTPPKTLLTEPATMPYSYEQPTITIAGEPKSNQKAEIKPLAQKADTQADTQAVTVGTVKIDAVDAVDAVDITTGEILEQPLDGDKFDIGSKNLFGEKIKMPEKPEFVTDGMRKKIADFMMTCQVTPAEMIVYLKRKGWQTSKKIPYSEYDNVMNDIKKGLPNE